MDICSKNHDEIVYDSNKCPLCEALESLKAEIEEHNELSDKLSEIENYECKTCHDIRKLKE